MRVATPVIAALILVITVGYAPLTHAGITLDQEQPQVDENMPPNGLIGPTTQGLAQLLRTEFFGRLCQVDVAIECTGNADDSISVSIQNVENGFPGDSLLAMITIAIGDLPPPNPGDPYFVSFFFNGEAPLLYNETDYALILRAIPQGNGRVIGGLSTTEPGAECSVLSGPRGDSYLRGNAFYNATPDQPQRWTCFCAGADNAFDIPFRTYMEEVTVQVEAKTWGEIKALHR